MTDEISLVKVPLRARELAKYAQRRSLGVRHLDEGYLAHCILRELWQDRAPAPFVLRGRGQSIDAWGYTRADAAALVEHARSFGDPSLIDVIGDLTDVASKPMPLFPRGRQVGFLLRACPVVRLAKARNEHRAGAEVDAFLARCFAVGQDTVVSRERVYTEWLQRILGNSTVTGATVTRIRVAATAREPLLRRTHGERRESRRLERPDVRFEGDMAITDGARFLEYLAHGVGRHRAFGFGALIVVPPGTTYSE